MLNTMIAQAATAIVTVKEEATMMERLSADLFNFIVLGVGLGTLAAILLTAIFMKWGPTQRLTFPGRKAMEAGIKHYVSMREAQMRGEFIPDLGDKILMASYFMGTSLRNGIIFLAVTLLVAEFATGGM